MTAPFSNHLAFKTALAQICRDLFPDTDELMVSWGHPGNQYPDEVIAVMGTRSSQDVALQGPRRPREEILQQDLAIVVSRVGDDSAAQQAAENRCLEILQAIEYYCRITDTTLGGVVRQCFLTSHETDGFTPPASRNRGWLCQLDAVFTARARISGPL